MTLDPGDVFLLRDFATTGYDPHYHIVVHRTALCAVDCNKAYIKRESECLNGFDFKLRDGKLGPAFIATIKHGVETSDIVSQFIKLALNQ